MRLCAIDGCEKPSRARGWCTAHYQRWKKHDDPTYLKSTDERFWEKIAKGPGCWNWTGAIGACGYGNFRIPGTGNVGSHRLAYSLKFGPIPAGLEVDHICRNKICVNPAHLRAVTTKQNQENRGTRPRPGVNKRTGKYRARVRHNRREHYAGEYDTPEEAAEAAKALRLSLFHFNDLDRKAS